MDKMEEYFGVMAVRLWFAVMAGSLAVGAIGWAVRAWS